MPYDKLSFLSGVAAGRNMESWPAFEASNGSVFTWSIDVSYLDTTEYYIYLYPNLVTGNAATIDWGDGSVETFTIAEITAHLGPFYHTYDSADIYRLFLYGHYAYYLGIMGDQYNSKCVISVDSPITFPDETEVENKHAFALNFNMGFYHLKTVAHGILKNVSRRGFLFGGALFDNCYELEAIPEDLLDYIDPNLLATYSTGPTLCSFTNCQALTEIPKKVFSRSELWSQVLGVYEIFLGCTSLITVPEGLFSELINCADFTRCFYGCSSLVSVGNNAFSGCGEATTFKSAFEGCSSLSLLGSGSFSGCSSVTTFEYAFKGCSSLTTLPADLFDDCYNVTNMDSCFNRCSGLQAIPSGLFSDLNNVTTYNSCFSLCSSLTTVPSNLFSSNTEPEVDFKECFYLDSAITSAVPELWVKYPNTPYAKRYHCYTGCTNAANYADIPNQYSPVPPGGWR